MKRIICSFNCFLQDEEKFHNIRHIDVQDDKSVYLRSNDTDGETRYYTKTIPDFEKEFKVNLGEYLTLDEVNQFKS